MQSLHSRFPFWGNSVHSSNRYKFTRKLGSHRDGINGVAFSNKGQLLASASGDGTKVWDLDRCALVSTPPQGHRGASSCVAWAVGPEVCNETVCFGSQMGYLVIWRQNSDARFEELFSKRLGSGHEIICINVGVLPSALHIAVGTRDRVVQLWKYDESTHLLENAFSVQLDVTVPSSLSFINNASQDMKVFGLYNGHVHTLKGDDGKVLSTTETATGVIGHAAASIKRNRFVVDNAVDGFDIYQFDTGAFVKTLPTGRPTKTVPKQVAFGEDSRIVVCGSDHGVVYLFDQKSGLLLDTLKHAKSGLVQTVATNESNGTTTIATASSDSSGNPYICLWTRLRPEKSASTTTSCYTSTPRGPSAWDILRFLTNALMMLAAILYIGQNIDIRLTMPPKHNIGTWTWPTAKSLVSPALTLILGDDYNSLQLSPHHGDAVPRESTVVGGSASVVESTLGQSQGVIVVASVPQRDQREQSSKSVRRKRDRHSIIYL